MSLDWQTILKTAAVGVGGTGVACAALAWLFKTVISEWLLRDTENFKTRLKTAADLEIEKTKGTLQLLAIEHQVMFARLHEKRAEVIEELHHKLTKLSYSAQGFVVTSEDNPNPQHKETSGKLQKEIFEYHQFLEENRIFLPAEVCELLVTHLQQIRRAVHLAGTYGGRLHLNENLVIQSHDAFTKAYEAFNNDIPKAQALLETEFRKMLGVK